MTYNHEQLELLRIHFLSCQVEDTSLPGDRGYRHSVWDLGYVSTFDCKLVASAGLTDDFEFCMVEATPDGKGLVILSSSSNR